MFNPLASAANPLALLANPAAVGNEFLESMRKWSCMLYVLLKMFRKLTIFCLSFPESFLLSIEIVSSCVLDLETVVVVVSPGSVIDRLLFVGSMSASSRLPQYLIRAMFAGACAVTVCIILNLRFGY